MARADQLNRDCACVTTDRERLRALLDEAGASALDPVFAPVSVYVDDAEVDAIRRLVAALETVVASPGYVARALAAAPATASFDPGPRGAFLGYDFHLGPEGPKLVEINTNAGGGLINALLARAQLPCEGTELAVDGDVERAFTEMFRAEWRAQRGEAPLRTVAIVDESPEQQFLYPEFLLFRSLFARAGWEAVIVGPDQLAVRGEALWAGETRIDLVYNRSTDFYLERAHALREAWERGLAVVTPHPRAHALYANKRNLCWLSDPMWLSTLGLDEDTVRTVLAGVPETVVLTAADADRLWSERKRWFFKPFSGHGSKATYRGDKLTTGKWAEIVGRDYVAQRLVPPSERVVDGAVLKLDVRAYVYASDVQMLAARLYQGQVTNLRTVGGGFATVMRAGTTDR